jgi:hypothetical protein
MPDRAMDRRNGCHQNKHGYLNVLYSRHTWKDKKKEAEPPFL